MGCPYTLFLEFILRSRIAGPQGASVSYPLMSETFHSEDIFLQQPDFLTTGWGEDEVGRLGEFRWDRVQVEDQVRSLGA